MAEYGVNIGRFMAGYGKRWQVSAGFEGVGYSARRKDAGGHGRGEAFSALTLDQLAEILDREEAR